MNDAEKRVVEMGWRFLALLFGGWVLLWGLVAGTVWVIRWLFPYCIGRG